MKVFALENELREWPGEALTPIAPALELVERRINTVIGSGVEVAVEVAHHLLDAGGKRLRPAMVLLSAASCGSDASDDRVIDLAAATELVHTASLVHDDVVDETRRRRSVVTVNEVWGNKLGVLSGDFLLAKAFSILSSLNDSEVTAVLTNTAVRMAESQVLEAASEGDLASWQQNYWRIIEGKTAAFMSACCECGAILANADRGAQTALAGFGASFGTAFQITDDLLDVVGDPVRTGKDRGADLVHGKFTLPVLLGIERLGEQQRWELTSRLSKGALTSDEARQVSDKVLACGATDTAGDLARKYAQEAVAHLGNLPQSHFADSLSMLARSVVDRVA